MTTPFNQALLLDVSPDGSRLLVRDHQFARLEDPLWVIPAVGEAPRRLGAIVAHDGAWSPDGRRLVFARGEALFLARSDGSEPRQLATTPGRAFWVRWSPDGARLRFTLIGRQGVARSIWEVSDEGHDMRPLPLGSGESDMDCCGEWSLDGRHFFFRRIRDARGDIWTIREGKGMFGWAAADPVRLTSGPMHYAAVAPTGDGRRLLVVGSHPRGENLRFDLVGREYVPYDAGGWAFWFAASRDRAWVAYVQLRGTESVLWRSRADGNERLQLTQPPLRLLLPRWSPDGTRIAFMGRKPGGPWKIYVIAADGGEPQPMLEVDRGESDPNWAPDGDSLMFGRPPDYLSESGAPKAIHILDLRTREVSTLPGSEGLFAPRWSPSGRYVAATTLDQTALRLFDFDTRTWTELGRFKIVHNPSWSGDERFLYFQSVDEGGLYRLRMVDRAVERVADLRGVCTLEGLGPDDSPLISCFRGHDDVYAIDWEMR